MYVILTYYMYCTSKMCLEGSSGSPAYDQTVARVTSDYVVRRSRLSDLTGLLPPPPPSPASFPHRNIGLRHLHGSPSKPEIAVLRGVARRGGAERGGEGRGEHQTGKNGQKRFSDRRAVTLRSARLASQ